MNLLNKWIEIQGYKHDGRMLENCDRYGDCLVRLPLFYELEDEEVQYIIESILSFKYEQIFAINLYPN